MGLFWDLIQQSQLSEQRNRTTRVAGRLDRRIDRLERDVDELHRLVLEIARRLEKRLGEDLDGDGHVG